MAEVIRGAQGADGLTAAQQVVREVRSKIFMRNARRNPFFALTRMLSQEASEAVLHEWQVYTKISDEVVVGAAAPGTGTSIVVVDSSHVVIGRLIAYQGEIMVVVGNDGVTTLTVLRGQQGSPTVSIPAGATLQLTGFAKEEGANYPQAVSKLPVFLSTNMEQFSGSKRWTKTELKVASYRNRGRDPMSFDRDELMFETMNQWERAALFNKAASTNAPGTLLTTGADTHERRHMAGLRGLIPDNVHDANGKVDYQFIDLVFSMLLEETESNEFVFMCSQGVATLLNQLPLPFIEKTEQETVFGRNTMTLIGTSGWRAQVLINYNMTGELAKTAYLLDMNNVFQPTLRELEVVEDVQDPKADAKEISTIMESCLVVGPGSAIIENLDAA